MTINRGIDQFHDPSFKTLARRIREVPESQGVIKTAQLDPAEHASLPESAFAWTDARLFPMHTPEHAALSYLYATDKTASAPEFVINTLRDALELYGVKFPEEQVKVAEARDDSEDFLLPERRRWRVTEPEHIKLAEEAFKTYSAALPVEEQARAAVRLVKKAAVMDQPVSQDVLRKAGMVASDLDTVREWVEVRCNLAPIELKEAFAKIAMSLETIDPVSYDREALIKLASTIQKLDEQAGFTTAGAGKKLYDPMTTVFNTDLPIKLGYETVDLGSVQASLEKLAQLPVSMYADVFGDDVVSEITTGGRLDREKLAAVVGTMPLDLRQIFAKQARAYL